MLFQLNLSGSGPIGGAPLEIFTGKASLPAASNAPIIVTAGDCFLYNFPVLVGGSGVNFTAPTAIFELFVTSFAFPGATALLTKNPTMTQAAGVWTIPVNFIELDTLTVPPGYYFFQIKVTDGGNYNVVASGVIQINANLIG